MELKNSALRTRVFAAALVLGLVIGAQAFFFSTPGGVNGRAAVANSPSGEDRRSPGKEAGLRPAALPGISLITADGSRVDVAEPSGAQLAKAWLQSTTRLKYLDRCEQSGKCVGFDDSAAYSYDLDIRKQQAAELRDFTKIARHYQRANGGDLPVEAQKIARYFLASGNDDVKEAALKLINHAPLNSENVAAALHAVETSPSGPLADTFLKSKAATKCDENAAACIGALKRVFQTGGERVQKEFACHSFHMMTAQTAPVFKYYEKRQDPRSEKRLCLQLNREEFERTQRGG